MSLVHRVRAGECLASIAHQFGFYPGTLWSHPRNAGLRAKRASPYVLHEGDEVFIPDRRERAHARATGARHTFRRRAVPATFQLRFLDRKGRPRAGLEYTFQEDDGPERRGVTDVDGWLREPISPAARRGRIALFASARIERYEVQLGRVDPITESSGTIARLSNLGFDCRGARHESDEAVIAALRSFQRTYGLTVTGVADDATRARLVSLHRS